MGLFCIGIDSGEQPMVKVIEVKKWDDLRPGGAHMLYAIRVQRRSDIHQVAERLKIPLIFKKKKELLCRHGKLLFWFKG